MNCNEEVIIKIVGKLSQKFLGINQLEIRDILDDVLINYNISQKENHLIVSDIIEKIKYFLAVKKLDGCSPFTIYNYKLQLHQFSEYIHKPINSITTIDIRMYLAICSKKLKKSSLSNKVDILKNFFGWLKSEDIIIKDPTKNIKIPRIEKRLKNPLTIEELELMRCACTNKRERSILEILYATGCRLNEITQLNKADINWDNLSIKVIGKGNKERIVYFTPRTKIFLKQYLLSRNDKCNALFVTIRNPIHRLGNRSVEKIIKNIALNSKINKKVFPHLLRATNASISLNNNADIFTIQHLLGHSDPKTTLRYAIANQQHLHEQYNKHFVI